MLHFQNKVVWITGASSGIGLGLALELARQGASVVVTGRRTDRLDEVVAKIEALGQQALALPLDVTDEGSVRECLERILAHFGRLDVAVANAGFGVVAPFEELKLDDYLRQFDTNVFGVLRTAWAALPALRESRGQLVIMGSVTSYVSTAGGTPYSMSKFAVRAFADGLRAELAPSRVAVTLICPGFVESEIRKVDNSGQLRNRAEPVSSFFVMPVAKAARQMAEAIRRRQPEVVITGHGKAAVFIGRHFPGLLRLLSTLVRRDSNKRLRFGRP
jgi:NAD(P)-dependent dehydrogenase (short-subunit alcohol dehydrogenase family)